MRNTKTHRTAATLAALALAGAGLTACSSDSTDTKLVDAAPAADPTHIIATTSVWADVASAVTGKEVPAIISGQSIDPHTYEASAADLAKIREAGTVVANGGHYDANLYRVAEQDRIIHAIPLSDDEHDHEHEHGHAHDEHDHEHDREHAHDDHDHDHDHAGHDHGHDHGHNFTEIPTDINDLEHIWLAPGKVKDVADAVAKRTGGDASEVDRRMDAITEKLNAMPHVHLAMTEPIAAPMIWGTELHDLTPEKYLLTTLNESEPSAGEVAEFLELIDSGILDFLVVNTQSTNNATQRLKEAAEKKNLPIVEINETPPTDMDFLDYFEQIVDEVQKIVDEAEPRTDAQLGNFAG